MNQAKPLAPTERRSCRDGKVIFWGRASAFSGWMMDVQWVEERDPVAPKREHGSQ